jgi:hypothetical protein
VKFCKEWDINGEEIFVVLGEKDHTGMNPVLGALSCPFGAVGDRIWVREAFRVHSATNVATLAYKASERNSWTEQTHRVPLAVCNKPATPEVDTIAAYAALGQPHSTGNNRRAGRAAERYQRGRCASRRHY